jgi:hypothetical protein
MDSGANRSLIIAKQRWVSLGQFPTHPPQCFAKSTRVTVERVRTEGTPDDLLFQGGDLGEKAALGAVGGKKNPPIITPGGKYYPDGISRSSSGKVVGLSEVKNWSGGTVSMSNTNVPKLVAAAKQLDAKPNLVVNSGARVAAEARAAVTAARGEVRQIHLPSGITREAARSARVLGVAGTALLGADVYNKLSHQDYAGAACTVTAAAAADACGAGTAVLLSETGPGAIVGAIVVGSVCYEVAERACERVTQGPLQATLNRLAPFFANTMSAR